MHKMFQRKEIMILFTLIILKSIADIQSQPAPCNDDIQCSVGSFCHTMTQSCHECLNCELLKRHPGQNEKDCIKTEKQCGPCFPGLINDEVSWGAMCLSPDSPEAKNMKILTSYIYILVTCVTTSVLLSLFIIHGIWNTRIIKVNIAIPVCKKVSSQSSDMLLVREDPIGFTA